jgi:hypothetical protein
LSLGCTFGFACGGGGGGGGGGVPAEQTGAAVIDARGLPIAFTMECSRFAFERDALAWTDTGAMVRYDTWMYARDGGGADALFLVNGQVIGSGVLAADLSALPPTGLNPRQFGCLEERTTVEAVLGLSAPTATTAGTEQAAALTLDTHALQVDHYVHNQRGLMLTSIDGQRVISMVTL